MTDSKCLVMYHVWKGKIKTKFLLVKAQTMKIITAELGVTSNQPLTNIPNHVLISLSRARVFV